MAERDQDETFDTSVAKWKDLLGMRDFFTKNDISTEHIDQAMDIALSMKAHPRLDSAIEKAKEMIAVASLMTESGDDCTNVNHAISVVFDLTREMVCAEDVAKWHVLKEMRKQLTARGMETKTVDELISSLFQPSGNADARKRTLNNIIKTVHEVSKGPQKSLSIPIHHSLKASEAIEVDSANKSSTKHDAASSAGKRKRTACKDVTHKVSSYQEPESLNQSKSDKSKRRKIHESEPGISVKQSDWRIPIEGIATQEAAIKTHFYGEQLNLIYVEESSIFLCCRGSCNYSADFSSLIFGPQEVFHVIREYYTPAQNIGIRLKVASAASSVRNIDLVMKNRDDCKDLLSFLEKESGNIEIDIV